MKVASRGRWQLDLAAVEAARRIVASRLPPTPLRSYPLLDAVVGHDISILVKHENHQPTNAFKVRNGLVALARLAPEECARGVVTASRGNHGQGLAWAAQDAGVPVVVCVPHGNNPEKNAAMEAFGAELIIEGQTYDDAARIAERVAAERGSTFIHSTNDLGVLAGAGTIALEVIEEAPDVDAFVLAVGGGSQAVGAMTVVGELAPRVEIFGVQAAAAPTIHDSWHAGARVLRPVEDTLADGLATGDVYEATFDALCDGLAGFVTVTESEIADSIRLLLETTHNLVEGGGASGLAGLRRLAKQLAGRKVVVYLTGGNIDQVGLRTVLGSSAA